MLLLALRQRNVLSCGLGVNLIRGKITNKMAHDHNLEMPDCVRAEWENNKQREFYMLVYGEDDTKSDRAERVILPLATATIIDEDKRIHSTHLIADKYKNNDKGYLFPSNRGEALVKSSMTCIMSYFTRSTVGKAVHPHLWRSIVATQVICLAPVGL